MTPPLLASLHGQCLTPPPVWLMRQAGRYLPEYRRVRAQAGSFMTLCLTPDLACEVTLQPLARFDLDAAIIFSDILLIPHALGYGLTYDDTPRLETVGHDDSVIPPSAWQASLSPVYQAIAQTRDRLDQKVALIGFAGAAWTLACYMIDGHGQNGFARTRSWITDNPGRIDHLIDQLTPIIAAHLIEQATAGAQALQLFDSWAGLVPESYRNRWLVQPTKAIAQAVRAATNAPLIGFPRGLGLDAVSFAATTGLDAVTLDSTVDPARASALTSLPLQGNVDPVHLLIGGEALDRQVDRVRAAARRHPFILNLGHGIWPQTPPEHVTRFVERIRAPFAT